MSNKKNIKMIVTDLDGTFLREDKTVSKRTIATFEKCRKLGIKTVYATGRAGISLSMFSPSLFDGRVVNNGALAEAGDEIVYIRNVPYEMARKVLTKCDKKGLRVASQSERKHYSNFVVSDVWDFITNFEIVDFETHDKDAGKLYCVDCDDNAAEFIRQNLHDELYLTVARDGLGQIMHREAIKSKALAALADFWNIDKSEIVVFGDDLNDIDMLQYAGTGVAMGNAVDEVKKIADDTCPTNEEDGIAVWLEQNVL
ncbi:MAG: Cof-type HAD-IIB family hydrolase [Oscillospiraceae bacterium]|jgi:Cof subfamily protein (haloacid dehalogenase superfamily)|nr:Cof-type HAD-IIB family hydrolase [Oscillospiraceae bacterium]